ncbi:hypothetical protein NDU88_002075 [Pleurodeles waltl]|uniref:Uncharacterized protein n=1 Tax=Pleurodeles waltl TaxID=8319 RepID=A0AAV7KXW1_PLEWA|nr:hypothetical protein NDU88_002075 [Pleurodeles waltl]
MAPGRGSTVSSPQPNQACGSTPLPSGTPTARRRVLRQYPVIEGPRVSPRPSIPGAPSARADRGKGLSRGPGCALRRSAAAPQLLARALLLLRERHSLAPRSPEHPGGASQCRESLQASPRPAARHFIGSRRRSAIRNVLALRHHGHGPPCASF